MNRSKRTGQWPIAPNICAGHNGGYGPPSNVDHKTPAAFHMFGSAYPHGFSRLLLPHGPHRTPAGNTVCTAERGGTKAPEPSVTPSSSRTSRPHVVEETTQMGRIFKPNYDWTKADGTRVEKTTKRPVSTTERPLEATIVTPSRVRSSRVEIKHEILEG